MTLSQDQPSPALPAPVEPDSSSETPWAIEVDGLQKTYSQGLLFREKFEALKGISFSVKRGEIFGLLGPNGAGKTTFLKILLGIIRKTGGNATMLGYRAGSRAGRRLIGYLPEHFRVPSHLTGNLALEFYGNLSNVPSRTVRQKREALFDLVGLSDRAKDRTKTYSKGMLQRLGLAQALLHDPQLLVLDEPTDGLDPRARADMRAILRTLQKQGVTIFLNSHLLQEVEMICHRVAILDRGLLRYCGEVDQIGQFIKDLASGQETLPAAKGTASLDTTGQMIEIGIAGDDPDKINACFQGLTIDILSKQENRFLIRTSIPQQSEVDRLVDRLRGEGISILTLVRPRISLEAAFLELVDE